MQDKTKDWAEKTIIISNFKIEEVANNLAIIKPACIDTWRGPGQHTNGVLSCRAITAFEALIGGDDKLDTLILPETVGNKHIQIELTKFTEKTLIMPRSDEIDKYQLGHKSVIYTQIFNIINDGSGLYNA